MYEVLWKVDPEIAKAIKGEIERQEFKLELIASENYASKAVLITMANVMNNKYAEGYPAKRYYGGCDFVDIAESLAIERLKQLFRCEFANVQPHSGAQANMGVYFTLLNPGDVVLGMNLSHGGHLTHGSPVNFSGKLYKVIHYGVKKDTETIDFDEVKKLAFEHRPKMIVTGASAYPREIDFKKFKEIADEVGALLMADIAHTAGLVAVGLHISPIPYADVVTATTHKTLRGPRGGVIMGKSQYEKKINSSVFPGTQGGPFMHIIAAKAVCFKEALSDGFKEYQKQVVKNAKKLADVLKEKGYKLVSGGTDTHLFLIDLTNKNITGKEAEEALAKAGITVNKNTIPFETKPPFIASGIRIGTPAVTTRGMKEKEMEIIGEYIDDVLKHREDEKYLRKIGEKVKKLCLDFPVYKELLEDISK